MGDVGRRGPAAGGCVWKLPVVHRHLAAQSPEGRWSPLPIIRSHPGKFRALTLTGLAYCMLTASVQPSLKRLLPQGLMDRSESHWFGALQLALQSGKAGLLPLPALGGLPTANFPFLSCPPQPGIALQVLMLVLLTFKRVQATATL